MQKFKELLSYLDQQPQFINNVFDTLLMLFFVITIRLIVLLRVNRKKDQTLEDKRRWTVNSRNIALIVMIFNIVFIWGSEIKGYALSVAAIAVAITMSFKEVITNFMGGLYRTFTRPFNIGDRISVNNFRGDVVDSTMMTTKILEVGPTPAGNQYTGNEVVIPNSIFLNTAVTNESYLKEYTFHIVKVTITREDDVITHEKVLMTAANIVSAPYMNKARAYMENRYTRDSMKVPHVEPRILIDMGKAKETSLILRLPVPNKGKILVEQDLMRRYVELLNKKEDNTKKEDDE